jgi:hypothetical protein
MTVKKTSERREGGEYNYINLNKYIYIYNLHVLIEHASVADRRLQ